jgi:hypothetical protein
MAVAWVTTRSTDALLGACLFGRLGLFFHWCSKQRGVEVIEGIHPVCTVNVNNGFRKSKVPALLCLSLPTSVAVCTAHASARRCKFLSIPLIDPNFALAAPSTLSALESKQVCGTSAHCGEHYVYGNIKSTDLDSVAAVCSLPSPT